MVTTRSASIVAKRSRQEDDDGEADRYNHPDDLIAEEPSKTSPIGPLVERSTKRRRYVDGPAASICGFFKLPAELRNAIYERVLPLGRRIRFDTYAKLKLPALLQVCRQIRNETVGMYYNGNSFVIQTRGCKPGPCASWKQRLQAMGLRNVKTDIAIMLSSEPNWANLMQWCKAVHSGDAIGPVQGYCHSSHDRFVAAAMDIARSYKGKPGTWDQCEALLKSLRYAIANYESKWYK
ncbi:hypothetical protein LTR97_010358 [Elasticomyces elasticus]|uniref:Uncharacterized protein n=1 Tax=Elasticomyces elasticus TaxID=574655 RepID=A0AAN7ZRD6_9PEZI|nr:hypothetical protein LTR97_010358 [Elasticomyces elasticus]KAK5716146.1 hypothetical protein LTR15_009972 [Elasticomyces elasticus]